MNQVWFSFHLIKLEDVIANRRQPFSTGGGRLQATASVLLQARNHVAIDIVLSNPVASANHNRPLRTSSRSIH